MAKKSGKKKAKASEVDSYVEIISRTEITFEDTKAITGGDREFKLGKIYMMIRDKNVPDASLEDMSLYENIRKYVITKAATCPYLLPCVEVIGWILPQIDPSMMIISNIEGEYFASFTPSYITLDYKLPPPQVIMTDEWVKKVDLDILECAKKMMLTRT